MIKINPLTQIDFYKADHKSQYPEGTEYVYSNFTPRSSRLLKSKMRDSWDGKTVFFGLQGFIKWFLIDTWNEGFFNLPKEQVVSQYKKRMDTSLGEGAVSVDHIAALHDLGYLPIEIKALEEGTKVNEKIPVFTVENTLPEFFWLTNYLETVMSAEVWKACNTATIANEYRELLMEYAVATGSPEDFVALQGHDFSFRGMSGMVDAATSGSGHLLSFVGSDTVPAIDYLENYYNADSSKELIACSVPASEHSVMCMGTKEAEIETFKRFITELYPSGIVSIVSDTWDFFKVITEYTVQLKDEILNRTPNALGLAKTVFRPDSGDPVKIVSGYTNDEYDIVDGQAVEHGTGKILTEHELKGAVACLWDVFGGTTTDKGYKVLHERVGLIYGDSITIERAEAIMQRLKDKGFASCNIVFGIGSYTYQHNTRDSLGFAMKATYGIVNGEGREIFKDPKTDSGTKKSARGLLAVQQLHPDGELVLRDQVEEETKNNNSLLKTVFKDGKLVKELSLAEIRTKLQSQ